MPHHLLCEYLLSTCSSITESDEKPPRAVLASLHSSCNGKAYKLHPLLLDAVAGHHHINKVARHVQNQARSFGSSEKASMRSKNDLSLAIELLRRRQQRHFLLWNPSH